MSNRPLPQYIPTSEPSIEYLSPDDAAKRLGVDVSTLYRNYGAAWQCGHINTVKVGRARRILWSSLIAYIERETRKAA